MLGSCLAVFFFVFFVFVFGQTLKPLSSALQIRPGDVSKVGSMASRY